MSSSRAPVTRNLHVKPPGSAEAASHDDDEEYVYDKDSGDEVDRSRGGGSDDDEEDVAAAIAMSLQQENKASGWTLDPEPAEGNDDISTFIGRSCSYWLTYFTVQAPKVCQKYLSGYFSQPLILHREKFLHQL